MQLLEPNIAALSSISKPVLVLGRTLWKSNDFCKECRTLESVQMTSAISPGLDFPLGVGLGCCNEETKKGIRKEMDSHSIQEGKVC